jgi:tRNA pseudouridine65 synthase
MSTIEIIYEDDFIIALNKAHGDLMHSSPIARDAPYNLKDDLSAYKGFPCFPLHRLDRKTSGICLFSKNKQHNFEFQTLFDSKQIRKTYYSIVRGFTPEMSTIDYPLINDAGKIQKAITQFRTLETGEIHYYYNGFPTIRYSLVHIIPDTGRFHQIRKHFAHIYHPIIGDRPHGCNKQNKLWKEVFGQTEMMLHAYSIHFIHPFTQQNINLTANFSAAFKKAHLRIFKHNEIKLF